MHSNETTKIGGQFHALTTLECDQKYTLLVMNAFGIGTNVIQLTLSEVKVSPYAQYAESVQLIFKPKGKRNLRGIRFHGSELCAIWKGWLDINSDAFEAPTLSESGFICGKSRYLSFDSRYITDAIESVPVSPLFSKTN